MAKPKIRRPYGMYRIMNRLFGELLCELEFFRDVTTNQFYILKSFEHLSTFTTNFNVKNINTAIFVQFHV